MNCMITGAHVKIFGKVIHCLSKFGNELFIQDINDGMVLRSVNSSVSAFASVLLTKSFFYEYDNYMFESDDESSSSRFHCKIVMKVIFGVFKSLQNIEKLVEKCQIQSNDLGTKLTVKFYCKCDIIKTYELNGCETEMLNSVYSKDGCPNRITMPIKVLSDILHTFHNKQTEITINANQEFVVIENEFENRKYVKGNPVVHTRYKLMADEFESYKIADETTSITFSLKEVKGIVQFSEINDLPVEAFFSSAGKPIILSFDKDGMKADFVLATLTPASELSPKVAKPKKNPVPPNHLTNIDFSISSLEPTTSRTAKMNYHNLNQNEDEFEVAESPQHLRKKSIFDSPSPPFRNLSEYTVLASDTEDENDE